MPRCMARSTLSATWQMLWEAWCALSMIPTLDAPRLTSLSSGARNRHGERTRCARQSSCRASFPQCETKSNWSKSPTWTPSLCLHYSIHHLEQTFCHAWYHPLRILPQAQINTALPLFSRQSRYFLQCVWSPTAPANAGPTTAFSLYKTQWAAYPCLIRFIMIYRFVTSFLQQTMLNKRRRSRRFVRSGMSVNSSHTHVFEGEMRTCLTRCHLEFKAARIKVILHFQ